MIVNGFFDSNGNQFDSIVRLISNRTALIDVIEQIVSGVHFLHENKVCHYSLEPKNFLISNTVKIASLSSATILPTVPATLPSLPYRAPELLFGGSTCRDDPLAVDLWSLGCIVAEVCRIFATRNRYEEPLFRVDETHKLDPRGPVLDRNAHAECRQAIKVSSVLNGGMLPTNDIWPNLNKRTNYDKVVALMEYRKKKNPTKLGFDDIVGVGECTLQSYCMDDLSDPILTEIIRALLRWSPEKRVPPRMILQRIGKYKVAQMGA
jgi:serine/threonine protein kinase